AYFIVTDRPLALDEKAAAILDADARAILKALLPALRSLAEWNVATTEAVVRDYAAKADLKLGKVAQPLRAALTGRSTSPGVFDVRAVLVREASMARIGHQIDQVIPPGKLALTGSFCGATLNLGITWRVMPKTVALVSAGSGSRYCGCG